MATRGHNPEGGDPLAEAARLHRAGRLKDAERLYRHVLSRQPNQPDALHFLGMALLQQGKAAEAAKALHAAARARPERADTRAFLATALQQAGRLEEAIATMEQAVAMAPEQAAPHYNLGIMLRAAGRVEAALAAYRRAVALQPGFAEAQYNLGNLLHEGGAFEAAAAAFQAAIASQPAMAEAHDNLGNTLMALRRVAPALAAYQAALTLRPGHGRSLNNLGNALAEAGRTGEAVAAYQEAIRADDSLLETRSLLAHLLQKMCAWDGLAELERQVLARFPSAGGEVRPFPLLSMPSTPAQQLDCARRFARKAFAGITPAFAHATPETGPITIGYLSGDFRRHPVAFLMAELLRHHDRSRFRVIAYSHGPDDGSAIRRQIAESGDAFVDLAPSSHAEAARRIHADGVDILVDLMGHTKGARTEILAFRPAPVQVLMLGYAATSGTDFTDYVIADRFVLPPGAERHFSERPARLPGCFMPGHRAHPEPNPAPDREGCGLPPHGPVLCSFNHSYKIAPEVFRRWMEILRAVPDACLWLSTPIPEAERNLRGHAAAHGIDPARIVFAPKVPDTHDHLARYRIADLFLDTLPYNAHATAVDALWGGCPVLTLAGDTFAGRVAGSLLTAAGLEDLIAPDAGAYVATAIALATDPARLDALRERVAAARGGPLFDAARYAHGIERAYAAMWARHRSGQAPAAIDISG
ncbi:MAG: tetratricopeptide repeat protein [Nitrospirae bacterium]|nr:tetratricopeptide repeat protein [Nitrospirota bacterium]